MNKDKVQCNVVEVKEVFPPIYNNIPKELTKVNAWVNFKSEWDDEKGKFTKPPCNPQGDMPKGGFKNVCPFDVAKYAQETQPETIKGVGFSFAGKEHTVVGLDFDHVVNRETGVILPKVVEILEKLDSYTEYSISGDGLHTFIMADAYKNPNGKMKQTFHNAFGLGTELEVFESTGYLTVSGKVLRDYSRDVRKKGNTCLRGVIEDVARVEVARTAVSASVRSKAPEFAAQDTFIKHLEKHSDLRVESITDKNMLHLNKCPWEHEHSGGNDTPIIYFNKEAQPVFSCFHAHCEKRGWAQVCAEYPELTVGDFIDEFNERFARVVNEGTLTIVNLKAKGDVLSHASRVKEFKEIYESENMLMKTKRGTKRVFKAVEWLQNPRSTCYENGFGYFPVGTEPEGTFNLFQGFDLKPSTEGSWSLFRDHWFNVVCERNQEIFDWYFAWMADILQNPIRNPESAVILKGEQGAGKTIMGDVLRKIIGDGHSCDVSGAGELQKKYGDYIQRSIFVNASEVTFQGDKKGHSVLKGELTKPKRMAEQKYKNAVSVPNSARFLMSTDRDIAIPAQRAERRFLVLEVPVVTTIDMFIDIWAQLKDGGLERLMFDLLEKDISKVNLRVTPKTQALEDEWMANMDIVDLFWYEVYCEGLHSEWFAPENEEAEPQEFTPVLEKDTVYEAYLDFYSKHGRNGYEQVNKNVFFRKAYAKDGWIRLRKASKYKMDKQVALDPMAECDSRCKAFWHL